MTKLVDVDSIKIDIKLHRHGGKTLFTEAVAEALEKALRDAPPVDAVPVIRCKDCKYYFKDAKPYPICGLTECHEDENDFCSSGERGKKNE